MSIFIDRWSDKKLRLPEECRIVLTGDSHWGALATHEQAFHDMIEWIRRRRDVYWSHLGDIFEGKKIDSPHFNPEALSPRRLNIEAQVDSYAKAIKPVAKKLLMQVQGSHDRYLSADLDVVKIMLERTGVPEAMLAYGHPQTWLKLFPGLTIFGFHGARAIPKGAKDPVQREANRKAWLKRELENKAGSAHVMAMGHTHHLLILSPDEMMEWALLNNPNGPDVRAASFSPPQQMIETPHGQMPFVPKESRFYINTGAYRRSGGFGYVDYAEKAGYDPTAIGHLLLTVKNGVAVELKKVIV